MSPITVKPHLVGDAWPAAKPGAEPTEDPVLYGHVTLEPNGAFEARSVQTFKLVYTVGRYGIDDTGAIRVVFRHVGDWGDLQTQDPTAYNYLTAQASTGATILIDYDKHGYQRPWFKSVTARLRGGYLSEGDTITITFGDTSGGSPGLQLQTFVESGFEFKVLADVCAVGHFVPLPETPAISIVPGAPVVWRAVLPSQRRPGESFQLGLKAEDIWGNPSDLTQAELRLKPSIPVVGLPQTVAFPLGEKSLQLEGLSVTEPGVLWINVSIGDDPVTEAGPLVIRASGVSGYWGDLHGQSGETIGISTARQYFDFARNKSFLDITSHQANDFQINNAFLGFVKRADSRVPRRRTFCDLPGF